MSSPAGRGFLAVALPSGRLLPDVKKLLVQRGIRAVYKGRQLCYYKYIRTEGWGTPVRFFLTKSVDIPSLIHQGHMDIGIVGSDVFGEFQCTEDHPIVYKRLPFKNAKIALITAKGDERTMVPDRGIVATRYTHLAEQWLRINGVQEPNIIKLHGSIEIAVELELAPFIIDIYETGKTLSDNGLQVVRPIVDTSPVVIHKYSYNFIKKEIHYLFGDRD